MPAGREGLHLSFLLLPPAPTAPGPLALLKRLVVQGTDVELVDVRGLAALETLDLRHNALRVLMFTCAFRVRLGDH